VSKTLIWAGVMSVLGTTLFSACTLDLTGDQPDLKQTPLVTLAWEGTGASVDTYRLHWGRDSGGYTHKLDTGTATTATVRDLSPGATYYFAVTAIAGGIESGYSNEVRFTADP
jgi:hypothetical protein